MTFNQVLDHEKEISLVKSFLRNNRLPHAILLSGEKGIGKLQFALAFSQYLNCTNRQNDDACGLCDDCNKIQALNHIDLHFIYPITSTKANQKVESIDFIDEFKDTINTNIYTASSEWFKLLNAESNQLYITQRDIYQLQKQLYYQPFNASYRVVIIWQIERFRADSANSFLKILEEPPENTVFIMIAENLKQVLPTIISRCSLIHLKPLKELTISNFLMNEFQISEKEAISIAQLSEGSLGNAFEIKSHVQEPLFNLFQDWMRLCYTGSIERLQNWLEKDLFSNSSDKSDESKKSKGTKNNPREFLKYFLKYCIKKMRDALIAHLGIDTLLNLPDTELTFFKNFKKVLFEESINDILIELELLILFIERNINTRMAFLNASIQIHHIIRK